MPTRILNFSIEHRFLVVLLVAGAAAVGVFSLQRLPIDAVPDITNNQVQINTAYPAFSPEDVEKQITFPVETALAGIPSLQSTRSLSRNGFSQVTAVFDDDVDIYFARNQINERLAEARASLPPGAEPAMGPSRRDWARCTCGPSSTSTPAEWARRSWKGIRVGSRTART